MRGHKKTKESGFFEGDSTETEVMTNTLKRTKVYTTSGDGRRIVEYSQEDSLIPSQNREAEVNLSGYERVGMTDFNVLTVLGTGAYGKVFLVRKQGGSDTGKLYAMKVLKKATIVQKKKSTEHTRTEREVLEAIRDSPFLVTLHYAFQTESKLHLILDYVAGGELFSHLYRRDRFTPSEVKVYVAEIIIALEKLHQLGIIYRDIKLENILIDSEGHIVITDFGLSKNLGPGSTERAYSFCGTIEYMAPEVIETPPTGHDTTSDWWSIGVLTFEMLTGSSPFSVEGKGNSQAEVTDRIMRKPIPILPHTYGKDLSDFIRELLIKDPRRRLGGRGEDALELKRHAFFKGLDWEKVARKEIRPPFVPIIKGELDVSNFSEEFTKMEPVISPSQTPSHQRAFRGYSYVSPSIAYARNVLTVPVCPQRWHVDRPAEPPAEAPAESPAEPPAERLRQHTFNMQYGAQFLSKYDINANEPCLGEGASSICRRCVQKSTGIEYAVKIVSSDGRNLTEEINLLRACQGHPNIVKLVDCIQDDHLTYLVMECLNGGELFHRIRNKTRFLESEASVIIKKLVSALSFMHERRVVHRDLKPENLVFTSTADDAEIKIIDFGFARLKTEQEPQRTVCFTLGYAAPEVLRGDPEGYDETCDLWSLGVILYTMLSGKVPFHARSDEETVSSIMNRIKRGQFSFDSSAWDDVSQDAKNVVAGLLTVKPSDRLRMIDLQNNHWVQGSDGALENVLRTPDILSARTSTERTLQTTFTAFHQAEREGFRLQEVRSAKLAQRRRMKNSYTGTNSTSSSNKTDISSTNGTTSGISSAGTSSGGISSGDESRFSNPEVSSDNSVREISSDSSSIPISGRSSVISYRHERRRRNLVGCTPIRQSERILCRRLEIDCDPSVFISLPNSTRKRKARASQELISCTKVRKTAVSGNPRNETAK
ncbi:ribosomal protein S6 kinase alpha-5 isoform X2 [Dendroctonus ponderosae]|uniref:ribosomal protein S6 kinase alpha-5 isoform X2 n=1 Tax=Dendroctonus ponderosae TaxID=77166 RepID=UPI00203658D2|nr:ribosomal protein S6 kinase alpha-5 isoform X2 [Dendroctonus ponderosae]KAH1010205.1 hypothetical protein HUJ05_004536 [Dendroctonus ponderosae]